MLYYAFCIKIKKRGKTHGKNDFETKQNWKSQAGEKPKGQNVVVVPDFADLKTVAEALTKEETKTVQYKTDEQVTGEYTDMKLKPLFKNCGLQKRKKGNCDFWNSGKNKN